MAVADPRIVWFRRGVNPTATQDLSPHAFKAGEPVTLIDSKQRRYLVFPAAGERHSTGAGDVMADDIIGSLPGVRLRTRKNQVVAAYRTTLDEYVLLMPRAATVIPPKDIPFIVQFGDIFPGATVVEAGLGSGGLTLGLLRAVGDRGRVIAYELREDHANRGRKNVQAWPDGLASRLEVRIGDVHQELAAMRDVDRVVLDLPDPQNCLPAAAQALKPGGFVVAYTPGIRQIDTFVLASLEHPELAEPEVAEVILRPWVADRQRLRPELRITGHTGFIARVRRRGPRLGKEPELEAAPKPIQRDAGDDDAAPDTAPETTQDA